jgi:predicted nucleic acid-binding protein
MRKIIVSDAGPLIALAKLNQLELLFVSFSEIHIPAAVHVEVTRDRYRRDAKLIYDFVKKNTRVFIHDDQNTDSFRAFNCILDKGESQALALADRLACGVLIDERFGRSIAARQNIPVVGLMGVLLHAKSKGKITAIQPFIKTLQQNDYRLSDKVIELVLTKAGEL